MSSFEHNMGSSGFLSAGADLSTHQNKAVMLHTTGKVILATDGARALGILLNKPEADQACAIQELGYARAVLGETVTPSQLLTPAADGSGRLVVATTGKAVTAQAVQGGDEDEVVTVRIIPATALAA